MRAKNRLLAVGVVGVAVITACIGHLTIDYSETEQKTMSYPGSASAGNVMVGQSGTTGAIVFSPATEMDNDTFMSVSENCSRWSLNLNPLPANVSCSVSGAEMTGGAGFGSGSCVPTTYSFTGTFTPTSAGPDSCAVVVAYMSNSISGSAGSGGVQTLIVVLDGTGVAPSYALTVTPVMGTPLEYTDIPINSTSSTQQITITNAGSAPLTVSGTHTDPARFPLTPVMGSTFASQPLAVGQSAKYDVACNPLVAQAYTATITFRTGSAQGNLMRTVALVCNGISSDLVIDPNPAGFARETLVGVPPSELTINIMNNGADTTFSDVHLERGRP